MEEHRRREAQRRHAVEHLLKTGCRRIAYLGDDLSIPTAQGRFDGFRDAVTAAGLPVEEALVRHGLRTVDHAREAAARLLADHRPDGLFSSQNLVTLGVLEAVHQAHLQHTVAHVGFDDVPLGPLLDPGVTVMAQDPTGIGTLAAERLVARMNGDTSPAEVHTVATKLIVRGSGELPVG